MNDEEIEKAVLYHIIFEKQECNLLEKDFVNLKHQKIIKAINILKNKKEEVSILTIKNAMEDKSKDILEYLSNLGKYIYNTSFETSYYILKKYTKKREIFELSRKIQTEIISEENVDIYTEKVISKFQKIECQTEKEDEFIDQVSNALQNIEKKINTKEDLSLYTGFFDLDALTDGLHNGEVTVIGARPAVGKTTFALQIAQNIMNKGKKVAFVSLEMSDTQIITKMISRESRVNSRKIRNGSIDESEILRITEAITQISDLKFTILTKSRTIQQIEIETRKLKNKDKIDVLIIDYLQLVKNAERFTNREQEVADISRTLKLLSLELDIPIIALCQLNRNASRTIPTMADIRESGAIEQDADNIIFLYQEDAENNIVTVDLQKQRAGNIGSLKLMFNKARSEFVNIVR
ncbi:MAG: AAA family ATPase [Clostridia bacterium]|nr:AAA family ATPase [Clostridia bacterium]